MGDEKTIRPEAPVETEISTGNGQHRPLIADQLVLLISGENLAIVPLPESGSIVLGRTTESEIVILDRSVSRRHARLTVSRGRLSLEDLSTTNGTKVQGVPLPPMDSVPLAVGAAFEVGRVPCIVQRAHELLRPSGAQELRSATSGRSRPDEPPLILDPTVHRIYALLDAIAPTNLSVLVLGETGVGKEVFAREIHRRSLRAKQPFVALNCAALPESTLEGELFGYERGAFTGANAAKQGLFESADGGTVFLDEIGELTPSTQVKLLRFLESGEVTRLGSVKPRRLDVRIASATNRDLRARIGENGFRTDLFFRINGITFTLPPLRERRSEIGPLAELFAARAAGGGKVAPKVSSAALQRLSRYEWPGNIRELRSVVERAVAVCKTGEIDETHLILEGRFDERDTGVTAGTIVERDDTTSTGISPPRPSPRPSTPGPFSEPASLRTELAEIERQRIVEALTKHDGNQTLAAKALRMSRFTLMKKLEFFGIDRPRKGRSP